MPRSFPLGDLAQATHVAPRFLGDGRDSNFQAANGASTTHRSGHQRRIDLFQRLADLR